MTITVEIAGMQQDSHPTLSDPLAPQPRIETAGEPTFGDERARYNPGTSYGEPTRSVSYKLNRRDLAAFERAALERAAKWTPAWLRGPMPFAILGAALVLVALVIFLLPAASGLQSNLFVWTTLVALGLLGYQTLLAMQRQLALTPLSNGTQLGNKAVEIELDGFTVTENGAQQACLWANVQDVTDPGDHLMLFLDSNAGVIIPKDAFESPIEAQKFAAYCREKAYLSRSL